MTASRPFLDEQTDEINTEQLIVEAIPIAKLIGLFVGIAIVPLGIVFFLGVSSIFGAFFTVVSQFVLAIGGGVVLIYCISRGIQLAED